MAREEGLVDEYEVVGDAPVPSRLVLPETNYIAVYGAGFLRHFVTKFPKIDKKKCIECRSCEKACPVGAIDIDRFRIDYSKCITCYVCHEICPENAIVFKRRFHI
jgi:formate hydrogenlyase subunit 6/NADH:ubiquinone oxidoreductase subunit I